MKFFLKTFWYYWRGRRKHHLPGFGFVTAWHLTRMRLRFRKFWNTCDEYRCQYFGGDSTEYDDP